MKCYAEYEVLQEFVREGKSKCNNIAERIDSCNGQDKKKEVAELCDELVRSKGTLIKYFQSTLACCEEESKKVTKELDELCSIEAEIGQQKQQQQQQNKWK